MSTLRKVAIKVLRLRYYGGQVALAHCKLPTARCIFPKVAFDVLGERIGLSKAPLLTRSRRDVGCHLCVALPNITSHVLRLTSSARHRPLILHLLIDPSIGHFQSP